LAKREDVTNQNIIISQGTNANNNGLHIGFRNTGRVVLGFWGNELESSMIINDTDWHHYAFTYDSVTKEQRIYIDGTLDATRTSTSDLLATGDILIGQIFIYGSYFNGHLEELRFWDYNLTQQEITNRLNCEIQGNEPDLIAYYNFNQGLAYMDNSSENTVTDQTIHQRNGTLHNFSLIGGNSNWSNQTNITTNTACTPSNDLCINAETLEIGGAFDHLTRLNRKNLSATNSGVPAPRNLRCHKTEI